MKHLSRATAVAVLFLLSAVTRGDLVTEWNTAALDAIRVEIGRAHV